VSAPITTIAFTVLGLECWRRIAGGQFSVRSTRPRIYQVTPKILEPVAGDTTSASQTSIGRQKVNESAIHRPEELPDASDATARPIGLLH